MTVRELIAELQRCRQDNLVVYRDDDDDRILPIMEAVDAQDDYGSVVLW